MGLHPSADGDCYGLQRCADSRRHIPDGEPDDARAGHRDAADGPAARLHCRLHHHSEGNCRRVGNIIHVTATGNNCCNYGDRVPAVWFYPGNLRLHIRDGSANNGNNGCDPEEQLVVDQTTTIRLEIRGFFMSVYYDDVLMCEAARADGRTVHENAQIFLADPWHAVANAEVDDVYILPLPPTEGCIDNGACNFDATASADDGSCEFPAAGQTCSGDPLYVDGVITISPRPRS